MANKRVRFKARCVTACFWLQQYWPSGKMYEGIKKPPCHFEILEGEGAKEKEEEIEDEVETNDDSGGNE